ncbi:MAG TPA: hypothetical protein VK994_07710, partial [Bacteroidales bacterium]|nr:hypothetical protein [Bacteroidales bacterium]
YHTNHPLVNDDIKAWHANTDYSGSNSQLRLEAVSKRMISSDLVNAEEMMEALKSKDDKQHPVCRANNNDGRGFTFASVVMHLGIEPYMLVCPGPPDENNYRDFIFSSSN